jgi:hypothetical protein
LIGGSLLLNNRIEFPKGDEFHKGNTGFHDSPVGVKILFFLFLLLYRLLSDNLLKVFFIFFGCQQFIIFRRGRDIDSNDPTVLIGVFIDDFRGVREFMVDFDNFPAQRRKEINPSILRF